MIWSIWLTWKSMRDGHSRRRRPACVARSRRIFILLYKSENVNPKNPNVMRNFGRQKKSRWIRKFGIPKGDGS